MARHPSHPKPTTEDQFINAYGSPTRMNSLPEGRAEKYVAFARALWKLPKIDYHSADQLRQRIDEFFGICVQYDAKPLVSSCAAVCGLSWTSFRGIATDDPEYRNFPEDARQVIKDTYIMLSAIHEQVLEGAKQGQAWFFRRDDLVAYMNRLFEGGKTV